MADDESIEASFNNSEDEDTENSSTDISLASTDVIDGLTKANDSLSNIDTNIESIEETLGTTGWFHDTLVTVLNGNKQQSSNEDLSESIKDTFSPITDSVSMAAGVNNVDNRKPKVSGAKLDDLKNLSYETGTLGAVLAAELGKNGKSNENKSGNGISGFFKGLLEGVSGITALGVALLVFAGSLVIFNFVQWDKALLGLLAFTAFTIGMIALTKLLAPEVKNLTNFGIASAVMAGSLAIFAVSLVIASNIMSGGIHFGPVLGIIPRVDMDLSLPGAIAALVLFGLFIGGFVVVANALKSETANLVQFAVASTIMSGSLLAFALSISIVSQIFKAGGVTVGPVTLQVDVPAAITGLVMFGLFITGFTGVAILANSFAGDIMKFSLTTLLMSGSLITFAVSIGIMSQAMNGGIHMLGMDFEIDIASALIGMGMFVGFITVFGALSYAVMALGLVATLPILAIVALGLSFTLAQFAVSLGMVSAVVSGQPFKYGDKELLVPGGPGPALAGLGLFTAFIVAFGALSALLLPLSPIMLLISGAMLMMSGALFEFSRAIAIGSWVMLGGEMTFEGQSYNMTGDALPAAIKFLGLASGFLLAFGALSAPLMFVTPSIALVSAAMLPMSLAVISFAKAVALSAAVVNGGGDFEFEGQRYQIAPYDEGAVQRLFEFMIQFVIQFGEAAENMGKEGIKTSKKLAKSLLPMIEGMGNMADTVIKLSNIDLAVRQEQKKAGVPQVGLRLEDVKTSLDICMQVVEQFGKTAAQFEPASKKAAENYAKSMGPIAEGVSSLTDMVIKLANLKADEKDKRTPEQLIQDANTNFSLILFGDGSEGSGFLPLFNQMVERIDKVNPKKKGSIEALSSMSDSVNAIVDIVKDAGNVDAKKAEDLCKVISSVLDIVLSVNTIKSAIANPAAFFDGAAAFLGNIPGVGKYLGGGAKWLADSLRASQDAAFDSAMADAQSAITKMVELMNEAGKITITEKSLSNIASVGDACLSITTALSAFKVLKKDKPTDYFNYDRKDTKKETPMLPLIDDLVKAVKNTTISDDEVEDVKTSISNIMATFSSVNIDSNSNMFTAIDNTLMDSGLLDHLREVDRTLNNIKLTSSGNNFNNINKIEKESTSDNVVVLAIKSLESKLDSVIGTGGNYLNIKGESVPVVVSTNNNITPEPQYYP